MFTSISVRTAEFPVPMDVQELMSVPTAVLTFKFLDPVECLIRLLTVYCDWVRKPTFTAVLSCKTVAFFSLDWCASRNLTFFTAV